MPPPLSTALDALSIADTKGDELSMIRVLEKKLAAQKRMIEGIGRMAEADALSPTALTRGLSMKEELQQRQSLLEVLLPLVKSGENPFGCLPDTMPFRHWIEGGEALSIERLAFWVRQLRERLKNEAILCSALELNLEGSCPMLPSESQRWKSTERNWQLYLARSKRDLLQQMLADYEDFIPLSIVSKGDHYAARAVDGRLKVCVISVATTAAAVQREESLIVQLWVDSQATPPMKLKRNGDPCGLASDGTTIDCKQAQSMEILVFDKGSRLLGFAFFKLSWLEDYVSTTFDRTLRNDLRLVAVGSVEVSIRLQKFQVADDHGGAIARQKVIKRKTISHLGHDFVYSGRQSALVLKCAHCTDLIYAKIGVKCRSKSVYLPSQSSCFVGVECRFTCHKDCVPDVYVRCIADPNYEQWEEMTQRLRQLAHSHHLEAVSGRTPTFCAHCGRLIPIGGASSDCLRCAHCGIHLHAECEMYLPALCRLKRQDALRVARSYLLRQSRLDREEQVSQQQPHFLPAEVKSVWPPYQESDFEFLSVIGKGNFGKVMLVRHKETGRLWALKILKKAHVIENEELDSVVAEQRVLSLAQQESCPFLVGCQGVFQNATRLFFLMDFVGGGDLMFHIQNRRFKEEEARFVAAEVFLALEFLHKRNVIYRDLKLDNILLALDGHIKLADYGLCKFGIASDAATSTFCGTPEFMAPEILQEKPYGKAVDWWGFGVLLYELLFSQAPFHGKNEHEIFRSILTAKIAFPRPTSSPARDIIQKLLVRNPSYRLGFGKKGLDSIRHHPFFESIDWPKLLARKVEPPFKPPITTPTDTSNFEKQFTTELPILTPTPSLKIPPNYVAIFDSLSGSGRAGGSRCR